MRKLVKDDIFQEGGWEIYESNGEYEIDLIPMYGGPPETLGIGYKTLAQAIVAAEEYCT